ncbi:peptidase S41 [Marinifilum sp. N1E240]|uniref:S41 family peptidase n=1 Tax=Marinifilum sp. N1E240 TaxID=2608082 RepID=UPI00128C640F|nr:S41 family peptidase [Marinifilum sp. N1E240]MPQ48558.1 peptidase S41 [Marinifilum sp. N1E240]
MRKYILLLIIPFLASCESVILDKDLESTDAKTNFEYLWKQCDEKYSYFDVKNIDWLEIKNKYESKITDETNDKQLFDILGDMLSELKDDHTNLMSNFDVSRFGVQYQAQDNFDWRIVEDNYIGYNYKITGPFQHEFIENKQIGYVRFPAFTGTVDDDQLDFILTRYKNTKGLILDLRENGGGAATDIFNLLSRFIEKETTLYYSRIKTGKDHNDFGKAEPAKLTPHDGIRYQNKIMVLIDRGTYSAGSFTALATKAIDNMILVGDATGGGLGMPNGGQLPNGWTYRFSITQALNLNMSPDWEKGIPADIKVQIDWNDRSHDEIIDRAIQEIL